MGSLEVLGIRGYAWFCLEVKSDVKFPKKTAQEWNPLGSPPRPHPVLRDKSGFITESNIIYADSIY